MLQVTYRDIQSFSVTGYRDIQNFMHLNPGEEKKLSVRVRFRDKTVDLSGTQ